MTTAEEVARAKADIDSVYEAGKAAQRKAFANAHQQNGERTNYNYAYYGVGWTDDTFWLEHDIVASVAECMFYNSKITNLEKILTECGKTIDFSRLKTVYRPFMNSAITVYPELNFSNSTSQSATLRNASAVTIPKFIISEKCGEFNATFQSCDDLVTLIIEGTIAGTGFDVSDCTKLSHDSLISIVNALKDFSGDTGTHTCTLGTTNLAKLTDAEKAIATEKGWTLA